MSKTIPNARPWKKGQSGNPKGRPRRLPELDTLLADVLGKEQGSTTVAMVILEAIAKKAMQGDIRAAEVLLDRAYGKARQALEVSATPQAIKGFQSIEDAFWADARQDIKAMEGGHLEAG